MIWYLEGFIDEQGTFRRVPILTPTFRVGRAVSSDLALDSKRVSRDHAVLAQEGENLVLRDLGSTNATFVNENRLAGDTILELNDTVHFATLEFRVGQLKRSQTRALLGSTTIASELPRALVTRITCFQSVLEGAKLELGLQPVVAIGDRRLLGYEILLRGSTLEGFDVDAKDLFGISSVLGAEAELSDLCRRVSMPICSSLPAGLRMFLNTHPAEVPLDDFLASLRQLRDEAPEVSVVLEIHEAAVSDPVRMKVLRSELNDLGYGLAYDDFGAGQDRLLELCEVLPDYLKFDIGWIRGIDLASRRRRRVLETLVKLVLELGIEPIAEGIETPGEDEACREMGFPWGQGYLYGRPLSAGELPRNR